VGGERATAIDNLLRAELDIGLSFLILILFNMVRAPFILDREQGQRILELTVRLSGAENKIEEGQRLLDSTAARLQEAGEKQAPARIDLRSEANLVFRRARIARTNRDSVLNEAKDGFPTAVVEFKNEPEASFPVQAATIRASVSFEEVNGGHGHEVPDSAWLKEKARAVTFRIGDAKELIIAVQDSAGVKTVRVHERTVRRTLYYYEFEFGVLTGSEYTVEVQLVAERPSRFLGKHRFKLTTRPELKIESV
jgi:hypothetical protein